MSNKANTPQNEIIAEDLEIISCELGELAQKFNGKTVLITGGAGFLGKYLVFTLDYLNKNVLDNPCKIIIADNFITGFRDAFEKNENIKLLEHDISKPFHIEEDLDYILHAASIAAPLMYNKYPLETVNVGFLGTKNMLELAREKNVKSFLFFSTSEVYGNPPPEQVPTKETYFGNVSCIGPRASYDEPKRIAETLCMTYAELFNIPVKIVRPFNVYGPGMKLDDGRGAINFVIAALKGNKIPVYGDGRNTRTWTYVSDATSGFFQVLLSNQNKEVYNVGSDEQEIEMRHLAEIVAGLVLGGEVHKIEGPIDAYTKADVSRRCPDLTKIRTELGYKPKINLVAGLRRFIKWAEEALQDDSGSAGHQTKCRVCENENLKSVLSLGKTPLANSLLSNGDLDKEEELFPLEMMYCPDCKLCQLSYVVSPEKMFKNYLYVTSTTETFKKHFEDFAHSVTSQFNLQPNSLVVDIGSNDGLLLKKFKDRGPRVVGIEPAENICDIARIDGIDTLCGFFNKSIVDDIVKMKGRADVVTANNVFAHVNNIKEITKNVKNLMKEDGTFIIEVQYLLDTIEDSTFDNIYHEHLSYFSVLSLNEFFKKQGMEIFNVEHVNTHGGSIRVYVQTFPGKYQIENSVSEFLKNEKDFGLEKLETYQKFAEKVQETRDKIRDFTIKAKSEGKRIVGYGAPAKATTSLNFYKINSEHIDYIVEDNPLKQGKTVPGVRIPIKDKTSLDESTPDYIMILAWNFADEIMRNNEIYHQKGAKFVVPSAELRVF